MLHLFYLFLLFLVVKGLSRLFYLLHVSLTAKLDVYDNFFIYPDIQMCASQMCISGISCFFLLTYFRMDCSMTAACAVCRTELTPLKLKNLGAI